MTAEQARYRNVNVETESAFGVENGAHSWLSVPASAVDTTGLRTEYLPDPTFVIDSGEQPEVDGSKAGSTFSITVPAAGVGGGGFGDGVGGAYTQQGVDRILLSQWGVQNVMIGDTVAVGTGAVGTFDLTTQTGLTESGTIVVGVTTPNNGIVWRTGTVAAGTVTLDYELPEAPDNGAVVYGSVCYQWQNAIAEADSFQAQFLNERADRQFQSLGCFANQLTFTMPPRALSTLAFECMAVDFTDAEADSLANVTAGSKGAVMNAHVVVRDIATDTYAAADNIAVRGDTVMTISRNMTIRSNPNSSQGADMFFAPGTPPVSVTMTIDADDAWRDGKDAGTNYDIFAANSRVPGEISGFYIPKAQQRGWPTKSETDGMLTQDTEWHLVTAYTANSVLFFRA